MTINDGKDFILLDIETTGLSPSQHQITEIGALLVDGQTLEVKEVFERLTKIKGSVPPFITRLTGITDSMLRTKGVDIKVALNELSIFCKDLNVFAHYSPFDKSFIRFNLMYHDITFQPSEWFDTITLFKKKFPGRATYKLESLMIDYKLATKESHRAIDDAMMTLKLLKL